MIAVVKADGYGHGIVESARAARDGGAEWLGVAFASEALMLRSAGDVGRIVAWLHPAGTDFTAAVAADIDLSVSTVAQLRDVEAASSSQGRVARVHLKADTGLSRGGATPAEWGALVDAAALASRNGHVEVVALWSHIAHADEPFHEFVDQQVAQFEEASAVASSAGLGHALRHLSSSGLALLRPELSYDLVRPGLAVFGLSPGDGVGEPESLGLVPAMTVRSAVAQVKAVAAGAGVSYSHRYVASHDTRLALVPLGYADGLPRSASNSGPLLVGGRRVTVAGSVCMDQVMVDLGADSGVDVGEPVVVFGRASRGEPTAAEWAEVCGTISYEIVTRMGPRVPRVYVDGQWGAEQG